MNLGHSGVLLVSPSARAVRAATKKRKTFEINVVTFSALEWGVGEGSGGLKRSSMAFQVRRLHDPN